MLPLGLAITERKPRRPPIRPRPATNLPAAAPEKHTPQPYRRDDEIPHHANRKPDQIRRRVPGVGVEGRRGVEKRRHDEGGHGVGGFGVIFFGRYRLGEGGREGHGAGQHDDEEGDGEEAEAEAAGEVDFEGWMESVSECF